ncbi:F-box domain-containing protein [Caenorhabditis elegans]|uniref:F-box domain-containing protein n=1 Tax=Caenorhabditis elegans TaxID=6239 RepID=A4F331_CAEEL|nr:F-box domain-containing protein [Caenorhabditis elegans]CCD73934.1 F-box domain-containing protein [Caenorhabditis elegans]|eukprot:NP_001022976.1 F-box A protein [Caenorhabditis elegans]
MSVKQLTLLDLPIKIANEILEKLEPVELLISRKVCRSLRSAIDENVHFNKISIELCNCYVSIYFDEIEIIYSVTMNGRSYMQSNRQNKTIEGVNCMEAAFKDLKILLKHTSKLYISSKTRDRENIVSLLVDILKEDVNIHVETIALTFIPLDKVLTILPLLNAKTLREISLWESFEIDQFKKITSLDQWKNAKKFSFQLFPFNCEYIVHLFHFEEFSIKTDKFPMQSVIKVRDDLLQRCTFKKCTVSVEKFSVKPVEIARTFQPDYTGGDAFKLDYSNGKSKFEINFGDCPKERRAWKFEIKKC